MSAQISGMPQLVKNLAKYPDEVLKGVVRAAQISQALVANDAKADHPYIDRSGNLTQSIQPGRVELTSTEVVAYVEARMQYASFVEFGTSRAHAYPFLTPAMIRQSGNYRKAIAREVEAIKL